MTQRREGWYHAPGESDDGEDMGGEVGRGRGRGSPVDFRYGTTARGMKEGGGGEGRGVQRYPTIRRGDDGSVWDCFSRRFSEGADDIVALTSGHWRAVLDEVMATR